MHIIIGGAHNGKRDYVRGMLKQKSVQWIEGNCVGSWHPHDDRLIVLAGIEKWLAGTKFSEEEAIGHVMETVKGRDAIVILTDIGRGIVPIDADERKLRDTCGRLNQRLIAEAEEVTRIWYGLAQTLKKRGEVL